MSALRKLLLFCSLLIVISAVSFVAGKTIGTPPYVTLKEHNVENNSIPNNKHIGDLNTHGISQ